MTEAPEEKEKTQAEIDEINKKRKSLFRFHIENDFPILKSRTTGFTVRLIDQIGAHTKGENKAEWVDLFTKVEDKDQGRVFSLPQLIRNYVIDLTRNMEYRLIIVQSYMSNPEKGRLNLDGSYGEVTANDAINAISSLKQDPAYSELANTHFGRTIKLAERSLGIEDNNAA